MLAVPSNGVLLIQNRTFPANTPNDHMWPLPAAQAMKSIRGRLKAACDPDLPFEHKRFSVRFGGLTGPTAGGATYLFLIG